MTLNAIKARLGSLPPSKLNGLPRSVQRLLETDMPKLIRVVDAAYQVGLKSDTDPLAFPARMAEAWEEMIAGLQDLEAPCQAP